MGRVSRLRLIVLIAMSNLVGSMQSLTFWARSSFHRSTYGRIRRARILSLSSNSNIDNRSPTDMTGWTVSEAYMYAVKKLREADVVEPEAAVPHLLAASLELDWDTGYRDVMQKPQQSIQLTTEHAYQFNNFLNRRLQHEPIQYILGQWDFLDYTISVRAPLLCPRPETEELVVSIIKDNKDSKSLRILDVGCGTGVIGLSLADQLDDSIVQAIDIEPVAVSTSMENARRIFGSDTTRLTRYKSSLVSAADFYLEDDSDRFDLVVSNPPYIPTADYKHLSPDVVDYESRDALEGGKDGMAVIFDIIDGLPRWCRPGAICWMEVDPTHPELLEAYLSSEDTSNEVVFLSFHNDMFGKQRFVKLQYIKDEEL
jgi:release factor glutamine methyltransferase